MMVEGGGFYMLLFMTDHFSSDGRGVFSASFYDRSLLYHVSVKGSPTKVGRGGGFSMLLFMTDHFFTTCPSRAVQPRWASHQGTGSHNPLTFRRVELERPNPIACNVAQTSRDPTAPTVQGINKFLLPRCEAEYGILAPTNL